MEDHICKGKAKAWWYSSKWCSSQQQGWVELCSSQRWPGRKIPNDSKRPLPAFFLVFSECWPKVKSEYKNLPHWRGRGRRWKMLRKIWRIKRGPVNLMEDTCASCDHFVKDVKLECHSALASDIFMPICAFHDEPSPSKSKRRGPVHTPLRTITAGTRMSRVEAIPFLLTSECPSGHAVYSSLGILSKWIKSSHSNHWNH